MSDTMKKSRTGILLLIFLFALTMAGCGRKEGGALRARVVVATDLHYYAPGLTDYGELFQRVMQAGDGKVTEYCDQITDAFLEEAEELRPEAVILTGDLSFNGERESHEALAAKLSSFEESGVPVLVLPGNHDLYRSGTYSFFGSEAAEVPTVTAEEFREIYAPFGFSEAISSDTDSLSYVAQLNDSTRVLMLDANTPHDFCGFSEKTLAWTEEQLEAAEEAEQSVLVCCHQNLFRHSMFGAGYVLNETEELQAILTAHRVPLFLSGHMHIQHIIKEGEITEIATSALTMGVCQYGVLETTGEGLRYETRSVDMSAWAERHGADIQFFGGFSDYALSPMEKRTRDQARQQLLSRGFAESEAEELADYAAALNNAYFAGDLSRIPTLDLDSELLKKWKESGTFFGSYFASIEKDLGRDFTHWILPEG